MLTQLAIIAICIVYLDANFILDRRYSPYMYYKRQKVYNMNSAAGDSCSEDTDCDKYQKLYCSWVQNKCVYDEKVTPPARECDQNARCASGESCDTYRGVCFKRSVMDVLERSQDQDEMLYKRQKVYKMDSAAGDSCSEDTDCDKYKKLYCSWVQNKCVYDESVTPPARECDQNARCASGESCDPYRGVCFSRREQELERRQRPFGFGVTGDACGQSRDCDRYKQFKCDFFDRTCVFDATLSIPSGCDHDARCDEGEKCNVYTKQCYTA